MPNTKSAERRMRSGARKHQRNLTVKSRLKTLERRYNVALKDGNKAEAATLLRDAESAFDKAAKKGIVHWATANRKKSRLSRRLTAVA